MNVFYDEHPMFIFILSANFILCLVSFFQISLNSSLQDEIDYQMDEIEDLKKEQSLLQIEVRKLKKKAPTTKVVSFKIPLAKELEVAEAVKKILENKTKNN